MPYPPRPQLQLVRVAGTTTHSLVGFVPSDRTRDGSRSIIEIIVKQENHEGLPVGSAMRVAVAKASAH